MGQPTFAEVILTGLNLRHKFHDVNIQELKKGLSGGFRPLAIRTTDG